MIIANQQTRTLIFISMLLSWAVCQDPIISTWYIGTRVSGGGPYNHYIELYNPTEEMINLGEYALIKGHGQSNNLEGQAMWGNTLGNSGVSFLRLPSDVILFPGQTYGITRDVSHESLQSFADLVLEDEGVLSVSGDDAVGLFKGEGNLSDVLFATDSIPIDCIGTPYNDPGASWQVSGEVGPPNSTGITGYGVTRFAILSRKPDVCYGNAGNWNNSRGCVTDSCTNWLTDIPQTSYEESEWNVYACFYADTDGNTGPGYEPETNPNCDEDILVMESFLNTCDLSENQPPISNAGPDQTVSYSQTVALDGSQSSDSDGTIESFLWEQISGTTVVLSSVEENTTSFTSPNIEGSLFFSLTVTDDSFLSTNDTIVITVVNTNINPVANAGPDQLVGYSETVTLDGSQSSDPDGIIESFLWEQLSGVNVVLGSPGESTTTFTSPMEENILVFSLAVTDEFSAVDFDTVSIVIQGATASTDQNIISNKIKLIGNYPNPFNPSTKIIFDVYEKSDIIVSVYNLSGQVVWRQALSSVKKGSHSIIWNGETNKGKSLVSGIYIYRIASKKNSIVGKMSLLK